MKTKSVKYSVALLKEQKGTNITDDTYLKSLHGNITHVKNVGNLYSPSLYYPIQVMIVSDEEINVGDEYIYRKELHKCESKEEATLSMGGCKKLIKKAPKNIIDKLIKGELQEGDEVEVEMQQG